MATKRWISDSLDESAALRAILEGTASATGEEFFRTLVQSLAKALGTLGAWVTEYLESERRLRALAFWIDNGWLDDWEGDIAGTPCETVIERAELVHYPDNLSELYPGDPSLRDYGAVSYMGVPLLALDGRVMGHLAVMDTEPMPRDPRALALFQIFATRAAAELERIRADAATREREEELRRLIDSAMDAIVQLDGERRVVLLNPAAEKLFGPAEELVGQACNRFFTEESCRRLMRLVEQLRADSTDRRYHWIPSGLVGLGPDGAEFPAEATLSSFELHRRAYYTLILRNVDERIEAERRIRSLTVEAEYLREEIRALQGGTDIIGRSPAWMRVLRDVEQVAGTDATVLICGETGTGKELVSRAIHAASRRRAKPLIRVNCAAIPAQLIESEFFGHEKGAFTGATAKREGRFSLADGGTLFLDEVGELPVDLQAKLLRVLQEGEFEPVGSSQTRKVDVRVLAATNRDLLDAVREGSFREDLYYRLHVFPIALPPLRDRREDIPPLAQAFAERCARRMGKTLLPLSALCIERLKAYDWPGNVRELENVIERAVITSEDGRLNLSRALPEAPTPTIVPSFSTEGHSDVRVLTVEEMQEMERVNILRALEQAEWRVSGESGAAQLLGMNPSTLNSRMKALGISRPR